MKIEIREIVDHGKHQDERVILVVKENTNLNEYIVMDNTYDSDGNVSNKVRHPFWFRDKEVKKGDIIYLYTKQGDGVDIFKFENYTLHHVFWGLDSSVWNNDGDNCILFHLDDYTTHKANQ